MRFLIAYRVANIAQPVGFYVPTCSWSPDGTNEECNCNLQVATVPAELVQCYKKAELLRRWGFRRLQGPAVIVEKLRILCTDRSRLHS